MAGEKKDIKSISRNNTGFETYDFDKLRREGIDYLGKLSGKIWTDHNAHDPGITILETLCYAVLDLGYRTSLPVSDLLTPVPGTSGPDTNFLTPAQVLVCNPLTITDLRKLLIDIEGIRNAWLEVATDIQADSMCRENIPGRIRDDTNNTDSGCVSYLNGLYHVLIDLENEKDEEINDPAAKSRLINVIKDRLMSHRNLCEDVADIRFLCKWKIGVCADIQLDAEADPEVVYLDMMDKLKRFFTPSPRFYTLSQLLDEKKKTMDEAFAGRPLNQTGGHGFLDTDELESMQLRKAIHLSDLYNVLFTVPGISKVDRLRIINCNTSGLLPANRWVIEIPDNHVPEFAPSCCGFQFTRNGNTLPFDFEKYGPIIEINLNTSGKIAYAPGSENIDSVIPQGLHRKNLQDWYSIQHDFPSIYGIGEAGLAASAGIVRQSQVLQLKGFLFFFDQLLANYLSQLANIRQLFAINPADTKQNKHTYFLNTIKTIPGVKDLLRFPDRNDTTFVDNRYTYLIDASELNNAINNNKIQKKLPADFTGFSFKYAAQRNITLNQCIEDAINECCTVHYVQNVDGLFWYFVFTSDSRFAITDGVHYESMAAASKAAEDLMFLAGNRHNYHSFRISESDRFSFRISFGNASYLYYLQEIVEDEDAYVARRTGFLNHILSRFAEKFTDYAMLSFGLEKPEMIQAKENRARELYLSNYASLSAGRSRGYNYLANQWRGENISGFEKKFKALLGAKKLHRESLCNYFIYRYQEKYTIQVNAGTQLRFHTKERFETKEDAVSALKLILAATDDKTNFNLVNYQYENRYFITLNYREDQEVVFEMAYDDRALAYETMQRLSRAFSSAVENGKVFPYTFLYAGVLRNGNGTIVKKLVSKRPEEKASKEMAVKAISKINDVRIWESEEPANEKIGRLYGERTFYDHTVFIDTSGFKIDIDNTIIGKPDRYSFEVLDRNNHFKLESLHDFESESYAKHQVNHLILLLTKFENYSVLQRQNSNAWQVIISDDEQQAVSSTDYPDREQAQQAISQMWDVVGEYVYVLEIHKEPDTYKFDYDFGYQPGEVFTFRSEKSFSSEQEANEKLQQFSASLPNAVLESTGGSYVLDAGDSEISVRLSDAERWKKPAATISELLSQQKAFRALRQFNEEALARAVIVDEQSRCQFAYQLVDKDSVYAFATEMTNNVVDTADLKKRLYSTKYDDYNILDLSIRGNNTICRIDEKTKQIWYHYQFSSANRIQKPGTTEARKLILLESVMGYNTREDAEKAFQETCFSILELALAIGNYGDGKPISDKEVRLYRENGKLYNDPVVFVPAETLEFLGAYPEKAIEALAKIFKSYPVRTIRKNKDAKQFHDRFDRCTPYEQTEPDDCLFKNEIPFFYFVLYDKISDQELWQSSDYYHNADEAIRAYSFFVFLLDFEGNYAIECDCTGNYKLIIREVLAESVKRFEFSDDAWGAQGVQRFIAASQGEYSFHAYQDEACCYRFMVACPGILNHSTEYDTDDACDQAIREMYAGISQLPLLTDKYFCGQWSEMMIDMNGREIARVKRTDASSTKPGAYLGHYLDILEAIQHWGLVHEQGILYLADCERSIQFEPLTVSDIEKLKEQLVWLSCYFPIVKKPGDPVKYCLEINIPGFNACADCVSEDEEDENRSAAWVSECCFTDCGKMLRLYNQSLDWLKDIRNYRKVFDCQCGPFRILLHDSSTGCASVSQPGNQNMEWTLTPVLANSPLCYDNPDRVCEAITRAKALIDREGLHMVEHILLRPRTEDECKCMLTSCANTFDTCRFPALTDKDEEDICDTRSPVCFEPGHDPYSFIATIALPAWPARFRSDQNKLLVENMLQREAPAHILLRILWLTPHDMCRFESYHKDWMKWMAYRKTCSDGNAVCNLTGFLFKREFERLMTGDPCIVCDEDRDQRVGCVQQANAEEREQDTERCNQSWLDQITELYCWKGESFSINTQPSPKIKTAGSRAKLINARLNRYKEAIDRIVVKSSGNELAVKTRRMMDAATIAAPEFDAQIVQLLKIRNEKDSKKRPLTKKQVKELLESISFFVLDKIVFADNATEGLSSFKKTFISLKKNKIFNGKTYGLWQPEEAIEAGMVIELTTVEGLFAES